MGRLDVVGRPVHVTPEMKSASAARWWSTSTCAPTTPGSGRPATPWAAPPPRSTTATCRVLPWRRCPALVNRDTRGLVKLVAEQVSGRILGVSMVADGAGDAIRAAVYAVKLGMTTQELADTWAPYLTMGEGLRLAAQAFTRDVGMLSCCAA
jgi:hypothetical protein